MGWGLLSGLWHSRTEPETLRFEALGQPIMPLGHHFVPTPFDVARVDHLNPLEKGFLDITDDGEPVMAAADGLRRMWT
jgi:hypothetical protein